MHPTNMTPMTTLGRQGILGKLHFLDPLGVWVPGFRDEGVTDSLA